MLIVGLLVAGAGSGDDGFGGFDHGGRELQLVGQVRLEDGPALVGVGAVEADDDRGVDGDPAEGLRRCRWPPLRPW